MQTPNAAPVTWVTSYEYKLVTAFTPQKLEDAVRQHMTADWQLTGGVSHFSELAEPWTQTMFRIRQNSALLQS